MSCTDRDEIITDAAELIALMEQNSISRLDI
jgi:hypothetical protein